MFNPSEARSAEREWVVYELVDPLNGAVIVRDMRPAEYVECLAVYPVVEVGDKGWREVDQCHREGRVPYLREVRRFHGRVDLTLATAP